MFWLSPNKFYAQILKDLYASNTSEMTLFLQLTFQANFLSPYGEEIYRTFSEFASEDLAHASRLAECITMLGEKPVYQNTSGKFLGGRQVCYESAVQTMLVKDIEQKENLIINYKTAKTKIGNKFLQNIIDEILCEEERHLVILKNLKINKDF